MCGRASASAAAWGGVPTRSLPALLSVKPCQCVIIHHDTKKKRGTAQCGLALLPTIETARSEKQGRRAMALPPIEGRRPRPGALSECRRAGEKTRKKRDECTRRRPTTRLQTDRVACNAIQLAVLVHPGPYQGRILGLTPIYPPRQDGYARSAPASQSPNSSSQAHDALTKADREDD